MIRSNGPDVFCKKGFLKISQNSHGNTRVWVSFNKAAFGLQFIKKDTLTHVLSCEFCEIFKNIFFKRTSPVASGPWQSWPRLTFHVLKIIKMQPTAWTSCHLKYLFPQISSRVLKQTIVTIKKFNWTKKKYSHHCTIQPTYRVLSVLCMIAEYASLKFSNCKLYLNMIDHSIA